jgi:hypothetical protein
VWVALELDRPRTEYRVAEMDGAGRLSSIMTIPDGLRVVGASATGLWLEGSGRIYALARNGGLLPIAVGTTIDSSIGGLLYDDCAIAGPCTMRLARSNGSPPLGVGPTAELHVASAINRSDSALSPNGRWVLLSDGLLDRVTGGRVSHDFILWTWRWSSDGEWVFLWAANEDAIAWHLADARQVPLGDFDHLAALTGVVSR